MNLQQAEQNGFKDSPIGKLPTDWDVVTVDKIAQITTGDKDTQDRDDSAPYPFFVRSQNVERINSYSFDGEAVLTAGDGVGTGKVFHYYVGKFDFHQRVYCLHSFSEDVSGYFFYEFFRHNFMKRVAQFSAKGSVDSVRLAMIADMLVPKPPKIEQSKIAEILSTVDRAIEQTEALIAKQQRIKTGLMQDLLTRGIDELGNLRSEETHEFKDSPLGRIPVEWDVEQLQRTCRVIDSLHRTPAFVQDGYAMVRVTDVKFGELLLGGCVRVKESVYNEFTSNHTPGVGDIVMSRVGTYGVSSFVRTNERFCLGQNTVVITGHENSEFLFAFLQTPVVRAFFDLQLAGSSQKTLSLKAIRETPVPIVSSDENSRVVGVLESQNKLRRESTGSLSKLRSLKTALMQDILTGEKRVTPLLDAPREADA